MTIAMLALWLAASSPAAANPVEKQIAAELRGWTVAELAKGDLNGDSLVDVAVTLQRPGSGPDSPGKAVFAIFLGGPGGTLRLHTKAPKAVCVGCGGPKSSFSDVLGTPSISGKGILGMTYEGGSREMWNVLFKWRYDAKTDCFLLIGETRETVDTLNDNGELDAGGVESEDINYLSGKMIRKISKRSTQHCDVKPALKAIDLRSFDFEKFSFPDRFVKGSCTK